MERFGIIHLNKSLLQEPNHESLIQQEALSQVLDKVQFHEKYFLKFETCMRKIYFFDQSRLDDQTLEIYQSLEKLPRLDLFEGEQAYVFILEVIAGLKSSIKGETEIFGQFKNFYDQIKIKEWMAMGNLLKTFEQLIQDCKFLREKHIKNWGSQSYGSVSRKLLDKQTPVFLLGSGHLAQEIAPWLEQIPTKILITRENSKTRFQKEFANFKNLTYSELRSELKSFAGPVNIILAAPIANSCIKTSLEGIPVKTFIDWRGDHRWDFTSNMDYFHLSDIKSQHVETEETLNQKIHLVQNEIKLLVDKFKKKVQLNPWGWDDICA